MAWTISHKLYENWRSLQAQAVESSEGNSLDGKPSAPLNITPTPDQYYWPDKTTEHSRLSRFGMTCAPLTASHGADLLMWYLAGFLAKTLAQQEQGGGLDCERSGLWFEQARIIRDVEPKFVHVENSPMLTSRGLGRVLGDLAAMGFNAEWGVLSAGEFGAIHERERIWIIAAHPDRTQFKRGSISSRVQQKNPYAGYACWWKNPPELHRMDDGLANGLDRLKAIGNGQVPIVASTSWEMLNAYSA